MPLSIWRRSRRAWKKLVSGLSAAEAAEKIEPQDKKHRTRKPQHEPDEPPTLPMYAMEPPVTGHAIPIPFLVQHAPLVAASPLPMQPLHFAPHFG